jgi:stage II sporulation protein M
VFVPPPRPDGKAESVHAYVRSSSLRVTGLFLGLFVAGLLFGYGTGPQDPQSAATFGSSGPYSFTVAGIFVHNLLVLCIPLLLFPLLFWVPAATSALTGYAVGQVTAAWLALHLPVRLLAAALLPHGVVEIPALLLGGTIVWRIGIASWHENRFGGSWNARASAALRTAIPVLAVVVLALGLAAFIEVKVTPGFVNRLAGF